MLDLIRSRPILSYFVLACGLSWLGWLNYILSANGLGVTDVEYPVILGSTQPLGVLPGAYLGPIGSALIVTAVVDGRAGLRAWAGRLLRFRVNWRWYAVSLLAVPAGLIVAGTAVSLAMGGSVVAPSLALLVLYPPLLVLQLLTTGLAEEPGWRDFALNRLQKRFSPLAAAAILGPVWALWHYPLFLTDWAEGSGRNVASLLFFTVFCLSFNVVMSWVFNRTDESLPLSMFMHVSVNNFVSVIWSAMFPTIPSQVVTPILAVTALTAAITIILATRGRLGRSPRPASLPVHELPALEEIEGQEAPSAPVTQTADASRQGLPSGS
ncbi:CPBP family intramembrane metalloprotease domain-containing protein [Brachybacterium endophyticum]|uniref:CPBP family intramembrane metalloprotease domain-containing protein n=1 Tax=Brachybacterium endophyticum TaxID=2182385 RepID=A0A2U2RJI9_9MICO|nr:type II CAAX endopeptidase family protein [Brachybacterium endophyticum]PWH06038.1 CPBP family intramembrane metalloprotease domain-containing protein [Brachybacterium endophyticum]